MSMKQISSVITTPAKEVSSSTSTLPIVAGVDAPLSGEQKEAGLARLKELKDPHVVDKRLLTSLESYTGFPVREISRTKFLDNGIDVFVLRYEVTATDIDSINSAIIAVRKALTPLPEDQIGEQLAMLATLVVKPSGEDSEDHAIRIKSLTNQLREYPADITLYAIEQVAKRSKFWPSFAEFYQHIEWKVRKRELMLDALMKKRVELTAQLQ